MVLANHQEIVVGVDGSPTSTAAALWAAALADRLDSPLHIACAVQEPTFYMAESVMVIPEEVWEQQRRTAEEIVDEAAKAILERHPYLSVATHVDAVPPAEMLVDLSASARLMVVGSSGTGLVLSTLLGSTAKVVADTAACPVVVWREGPGDPNSPILVGIDGSATSAAAIAMAFEIASRLEVPLIAAHVWSAASQAGGVTLPLLIDWAAIEKEESVLLAESLAGWVEKYPDVVVERVLRQSNPAHTLVDLSEHAQLVVVGSRGRGPVRSALLGSTSSNLTHHARCPVMICRVRS